MGRIPLVQTTDVPCVCAERARACSHPMADKRWEKNVALPPPMKTLRSCRAIACCRSRNASSC